MKGGFYVLVNIYLVSAHPGLLLSLKIAPVGAQQKTRPFVGVRKEETQVSSMGNNHPKAWASFKGAEQIVETAKLESLRQGIPHCCLSGLPSSPPF